MARKPPNSETLRAEARLLTIAGVMLLVIGFPLTLLLVADALREGGGSAVLPLAIGLPPLALGYLACHFASQRMLKAKALERGARGDFLHL
ncbi:MAG: hypothetical protein JNK94_06685 [Hyphomonadaceae bacterium]|nr:hypothetical protein [Hyphomonadaceae bacterium]MBX3509670.1 hypothetical protein [Hyphomonadaceae bacterium]